MGRADTLSQLTLPNDSADTPPLLAGIFSLEPARPKTFAPAAVTPSHNLASGHVLPVAMGAENFPVIPEWNPEVLGVAPCWTAWHGENHDDCWQSYVVARYWQRGC